MRERKWAGLVFVLCLLVWSSEAVSFERHVYPGQSIQATINTAVNGDMIVVHEGIYVENIDFLGKAVTVTSTEPDNLLVANATIIDGSWAGNVITFANAEKNDSVINGITIQHGVSLESGGGILCRSSSPVISNCTIKENYGRDGAGIFCEKSSPIIVNCNIWGNSASRNGGGFYSDDGSSPIIANCTFSNNEAEGMFIVGHSTMVVNCIIWGNRPNEVNPLSCSIAYSDISQAGYPGVGNICVDPMFVDPENGDYTLMPGSPCIDKGDCREVSLSEVRLAPANQGAKGGPLLARSLFQTGDYSSDAYEANEKAGYFEIWRDKASGSLTVYYTTSGTATSGSDYQKLSGVITIPSGSDHVRVYVYPIDDTTNEGTETIDIKLSWGGSYNIISGNIYVNIYDNDSEVTIEAVDKKVPESDKNAVGKFTVKRRMIPRGKYPPLTVNYSVNGTAKGGTDYTKLPGSVTIGEGKSSADIIVNPKDDSISEGDETVEVALLSSSSYKVASPNKATVTIIDDDNIPTVSVNYIPSNPLSNGITWEGTKAKFQISRTGNTTDKLVVQFKLSGTAVYLADYTTTPAPLYPSFAWSLPIFSYYIGDITIAPGSSLADIVVTVKDDDINENVEKIECAIVGSSSYKVSSAYSSTAMLISDNTWK